MSRRHSKLLLIGLVIIFTNIFVLPSKIIAQSNGISVNVLPENPSPYEDTSITLNSYADNLDSVLITWSVNGKDVLSGIGKKSFLVKAGAAGSETVVLATTFLPAGTVETRIIIRPSVMVLLWQANDSYVPPFYKGKAMPTLDSEIKVVAIPEIKTDAGLVNPKNMTYAWKKDYTNDQEGSGYGKNFFLYTNDYLENSNNVSVVTSTVDQKYSSEASIDIGATQPKILFYKNDDKVGTIWEQILLDGHRIQSDEIITAVPYFISPKDIRSPRLIFNWSINNNPVSIVGLQKNSIPLRVESGTSGTSRLKLEIENKDKIFQTTSKEINIEF